MSNEFKVGGLVEMPVSPQSKKDLKGSILGFIDNLIETGEHDAIEIYAKLKYAHEICAIALGSALLKGEALEEVANDNGAVMFRQSMKLEKIEMGGKYDYSKDDEWRKFTSDISAMQVPVDIAIAGRKVREGYLKSIAKSGKSEAVDPVSGEIAHAPKLIKGGATTIKVTF